MPRPFNSHKNLVVYGPQVYSNPSPPISVPKMWQMNHETDHVVGVTLNRFDYTGSSGKTYITYGGQQCIIVWFKKDGLNTQFFIQNQKGFSTLFVGPNQYAWQYFEPVAGQAHPVTILQQHTGEVLFVIYPPDVTTNHAYDESFAYNFPVMGTVAQLAEGI